MAQRMIDLKKKLESQKSTNQLKSIKKIHKTSSTQTENTKDICIRLINKKNEQSFLNTYKSNCFSIDKKTLIIDEQLWRRFQQFEIINQLFKDG
jgi:hypothetical protein